VRRSDYEFLISRRARELLEAEGIVLIDYRPLQRLWSQAGGPGGGERLAP
jgi:hypothetical protein